MSIEHHLAKQTNTARLQPLGTEGREEETASRVAARMLGYIPTVPDTATKPHTQFVKPTFAILYVLVGIRLFRQKEARGLMCYGSCHGSFGPGQLPGIVSLSK